MAEDNSRTKWRVWLWSYAPILLWVSVIFFLSGDQGAMPSTSRFIRPLLELIFPGASEATLQLYHGYIRKSAHFGEYAILALLAARAFRLSGSFFRRLWAPMTVLFAALVAVADETKQLYSATRTGSAFDVLIDVSGAVFATLAVWLLSRRRSSRSS